MTIGNGQQLRGRVRTMEAYSPPELMLIPNHISITINLKGFRPPEMAPDGQHERPDMGIGIDSRRDTLLPVLQ